MNLTLGQVVYSKAGRDNGKKFVVIEIIDEAYVNVSDGDLRRIEKPKKKKVKHLEPTKDICDTIGQKLVNKQKVSNSDLRKTLADIENRMVLK